MGTAGLYGSRVVYIYLFEVLLNAESTHLKIIFMIFKMFMLRENEKN